MRIRKLLELQFKVYKMELFSLILANLLCGFFVNFIELPAMLELGIVGVLCVFSFNFFRTATIYPDGVGANRFNWKYFQNLPLTKKETLQLAVLSLLFVSIPIIFWSLSFLPTLSDVVFKEGEVDLTILSYLKVFVSLIAFVFFSSLLGASAAIHRPRLDVQKIDFQDKLLVGLKNMTLIATIITYTLVVMMFLFQFPTIKKVIGITLRNLVLGAVSLNYWMIPIILIVMGIWHYRTAIKIWGDERLSYKGLYWDKSKDAKVFGFCCFLMVYPIYSEKAFVFPEDRGNDLHFATYREDTSKVNKLLTSKDFQKLIYEKNKSGYLPVHLAIKSGNVQIYKAIKKKMNSFEVDTRKYITRMDPIYLAITSGSLDMLKAVDRDFKGTNRFIYDKKSRMTYLHLVAGRCHTKMIDYMYINWDADANAIDINKRTPGHYAAGSGCLSTVATLYEMGAQFHFKDVDGKQVKDFIKKKSYERYPGRIAELTYYVEKRTRKPASKP